jgi:hypothetical protein
VTPSLFLHKPYCNGLEPDVVQGGGISRSGRVHTHHAVWSIQ